ncbi:ATP-grasp domain-containing protein [Actinoplanes regularis]|uniref:Biotin carboxylase n=1 Tax=Actinoplanes regularis TaxID=52697 RepID=A0A238X6J4_9ACTN|nr:ATP-grasp domain-containing protein [Actinoplanes regularis]GIE86467.1 argininosuccinate lyase [Actinoplanes regularis]SNR54163.1 Biotin carboxylase [Actinoplanes regularis]
MNGKLVIVEALGTGHGLRLLETACRMEVPTVFITTSVDRYSRDVSREVLDSPPPSLRIYSGVDTRDAGAIADSLTRVGRIGGILAPVDRSLSATAQACAKLGLPFLDSDVVGRCADKAAFREACNEAGVAQVRAIAADTVGGALTAAEQLGYPVVVKPATGTASLGVRAASSSDEVTRAAELILSGAEGLSSRVLVEEYLVGPLVSAEVFRRDGQTLLLGLTDRILSAPPTFAELAWTFPLALPPDTSDQIRDVCVRVLDAVGFTQGPAHVELVLTASGPRVVEINPRMAGRGLSYLVSTLSGYDEYALTVAAAIGAPAPAAAAPTTGRYGAEHVVSGPVGTTVGEKDMEIVRNLPGVEFVRLAPGGRNVTPIGDGHYDLGEVLAWGATFAEAQMRARSAAQFLMGRLRPDHP